MNDIRLIHRRAMEARDFGLQEKLAGNDRAAGHHLENAYHLEAEAANELFGNFDSEPTRSVLYRSAATLVAGPGRARTIRRRRGIAALMRGLCNIMAQEPRFYQSEAARNRGAVGAVTTGGRMPRLRLAEVAQVDHRISQRFKSIM
jgi:hypothetical protein